MRVDGRPNRSRKISVFKQKRIRDVWKRRKRFPSFQRVRVDGQKRFEYATCGSLFFLNTEKKISVFKNMRISKYSLFINSDRRDFDFVGNTQYRVSE